MQLDQYQASVVDAPVGSRLLVEAAPGCGKTHVACARIASLLSLGVSPDSLLLVSFTRTAVHELRNRIATLVKGGMNIARGVEIRTIDSLAWRIATGAEEVGTISSYQDSIVEAVRALARSGGKGNELRGYLGRFSHVLVDEAQDLVGSRASFVIEFLNRLRPDAGWTVFLDPAQAIYGWSTDSEDLEEGRQFLDMTAGLKGDISRASLTTTYRTSNADLLQLMSAIRSHVLHGPSGHRLKSSWDELDSKASGEVSSSELAEHLHSLGADASDHLVLYRRRIDALTTLSYLRQKGGGGRLRLGGLPRVAAPWLSILASWLYEADIALDSVSQDDVYEAWSATLASSWLARGMTPEDAWALLRRIAAAGGGVDMRKVAARLASLSLPDEIFSRELGTSGATIGTIHGSKGREAPHVLLCLPDACDSVDENDASDEEARVLYVAASRAVRSLDVRRSSSRRCGYLDDRAWHSSRDAMSVELGRDGDVDALWPMLMANGIHASAIQGRLAAFNGTFQSVHVRTNSEETSWTRRLELDSGEVLGALSMGCVSSLKGIVTERAGRKKTAPLSMMFLTWIDVTTVAISADDARATRLPAPWRETRMLLAPVIAGMGRFKRYW